MKYPRLPTVNTFWLYVSFYLLSNLLVKSRIYKIMKTIFTNYINISEN